MGYDDAPDRLVTEARNLGFEVVRIDPARQIHSAEDVTLVNPTGSTIGFMLKDVVTGRHSFVPIDGLPSTSTGPGIGETTELPPAPIVFFRPFCPEQHDERFGGTLVDGAWHGGEHSTLEDAQLEAANHNATTGHAAFAKRYIEA
jgi:hypothetical protein